MNIQKLLISLLLMGFAINTNQSQAMSLEQHEYTVSSNNANVWICVGDQIISGKLKRLTLHEQYVETIRFVFPGNHFQSIDRTELPGDLSIRVLTVAPNSYTVILKSIETNEQVEHHFDY